MQTFSGSNPVPSGIETVTDKEVLAVIEKVVEKIVRVDVSDGR
jgi:hypothetical protein